MMIQRGKILYNVYDENGVLVAENIRGDAAYKKNIDIYDLNIPIRSQYLLTINRPNGETEKYKVIEVTQSLRSDFDSHELMAYGISGHEDHYSCKVTQLGNILRSQTPTSNITNHINMSGAQISQSAIAINDSSAHIHNTFENNLKQILSESNIDKSLQQEILQKIENLEQLYKTKSQDFDDRFYDFIKYCVDSAKIAKMVLMPILKIVLPLFPH